MRIVTINVSIPDHTLKDSGRKNVPTLYLRDQLNPCLLMGKKNKLQKFADLLEFPNVVESFDMDSDLLIVNSTEERNFAGAWKSDFFKNDGSINLELACGKGEYSLGLSAIYPDRNYIGVDIKGNRIWKGAKRALSENRKNVGFLRTRIERIDRFFTPGEVDSIWVIFPDPFPRASKENRRLTSPFFLSKYTKVLKPGSFVQLKTDAPALFDFTIESMAEHPSYEITQVIDDVYAQEEVSAELNIKTFYEESHLKNGRTISYIQAQYQP